MHEKQSSTVLRETVIPILLDFTLYIVFILIDDGTLLGIFR